MSTRTSISPHQKYSTPTSNRPHQKYSTDGSIGGSKRCPTCSSVIESSPATDESSPATDESSPAIDESSPSSVLWAGKVFSRPYNVVFFMSFMHTPGKSDYCKDKKDIVRMYKIQIYPESRLEDESRVLKIRHLWEGLLPQRSSFAALDSNVYCFGGRKISPSTFVPYVYMLDTFPPSRCLPMPSMNFPRMEPKSLVLGGNVYVLSGDYGSFFGSEPTNRGEVEVYYPMDGRWDVLPDPPIPLEWKFICAALENPDRILVAPRTEPGKALFCIYDVGQGNWKLLDNPERKIHNLCPLGVGGALTVGSTIYWITRNFMLLAYLLDEDMWLSRDLYCLQTSYFGYKEWGRPALLYLKDHKKICMVQSAPENMVICVILEVFENLSNKRLDVSVVSVQKFEAEMILPVKHCFLLPGK